jgi:hypothetical protein
MTYPHEKLVTDWLQGKPIQYKKEGAWVDLPRPDLAEKMPHFYASGEYRPKPRSVRFRVAEMRDGALVAVRSQIEEFNVVNTPSFAGWLTDWAEVAR